MLTTTGLKWDVGESPNIITLPLPLPLSLHFSFILTCYDSPWRSIENWKSSFGTQISTSNALVGSRVTIETNAPVVWTTELKSR